MFSVKSACTRQKIKMEGKFKRGKYFNTLWVAANLLVIIAAAFIYFDLSTKFRKMTLRCIPKSQLSGDTFPHEIGIREANQMDYSSSSEMNSPSSSVIRNNDDKCVKSVLLFGLRPLWLQVCTRTVFPEYEYLVKFPRVVDCPAFNCSVVLNHTDEPVEMKGYDVVLFTNVYNWLTEDKWDWAHGNRTKGQRWVMVTQESPLYVPGVQPPSKYGKVTYDWTDTYKRDAEFFNPYGAYAPYEGNKPLYIDEKRFIQNKTKLIAWMASHCETLHWDRLKFVHELQTIINVDTYGKCGDGTVEWSNQNAIVDTFSKYKFYLSLENCCCDDYITEKFWRSLKLGMVPVVVGAPYEHYLKFAPPNSFIHMDMFDSMSELAAYLLELHTNDNLYKEYFKWRNMGVLTTHIMKEHFVLPLIDETQCSLLSKYLETEHVLELPKLDYFGPSWYESCTYCGRKSWINTFMYPKNYSRSEDDIWA